MWLFNIFFITIILVLSFFVFRTLPSMDPLSQEKSQSYSEAEDVIAGTQAVRPLAAGQSPRMDEIKNGAQKNSPQTPEDSVPPSSTPR